jgi:hypothetical protein
MHTRLLELRPEDPVLDIVECHLASRHAPCQAVPDAGDL